MRMRIQTGSSSSSSQVIEPEKVEVQKFESLRLESSIEPLERQGRRLLKEMISSAMQLLVEKSRETIDMIADWQTEFFAARRIDSDLNELEKEDAINDLCLLHYNLECAIEEIKTDDETIVWDQHLENLRLWMQKILGKDVDILEILSAWKKGCFEQDNLSILEDLEILDQKLEQAFKQVDQEISEDAAFVLENLEGVHQQNGETIEAIYRKVDALNEKTDRVQERMEREIIEKLKIASAALKEAGKEAIATSEELSNSLKKV